MDDFKVLAEFIREHWVIVLPLAILALTIMITALVHAIRAKSFKLGNRFIWIPAICLSIPLGAVLYFILAAKSAEEDEDENE